MEIICSKSNNNVKFVRSLNEKKFRMKNNAFYLEGIKVVNEILDKEKAIDIKFIAYSKSILLTSNGGKEILERIESIENIKILEFDENIFKYVTDTVTPQGILIVLEIPKYDLESELKSNNNNILILDNNNKKEYITNYEYNFDSITDDEISEPNTIGYEEN